MCFGVVIAKRNDNNCYKEEITNLLNDNIKRVEEYYLNKMLPSINPIVDLGNSMKTRRWIWRQGEVIVGFIDKENKEMNF